MLGIWELCVGNRCSEIFACVAVYVCLYFEIKAYLCDEVHAAKHCLL